MDKLLLVDITETDNDMTNEYDQLQITDNYDYRHFAEFRDVCCIESFVC